ncbi:hypothetical protein YC2023_040249 [Brassica napus]
MSISFGETKEDQKREATSSKESASSESKDQGKDETHTRGEIRLKVKSFTVVSVENIETLS